VQSRACSGGGKWSVAAIASPGRLRQIAAREGRGAASSAGQGAAASMFGAAARHPGKKPDGNLRQPVQILGANKTHEIVRSELQDQVPERHRTAEAAEIGVEVAVYRYEVAHVDPD
jgi:hypothetical protein